MTTTWNETDALPAPEAMKPEAASSAPAIKKTSRAKIVLPVLVALAATVGGAPYVRGLGVEATDDAQVEGHILNVAARATGQVARPRAR